MRGFKVLCICETEKSLTMNKDAILDKVQVFQGLKIRAFFDQDFEERNK
jgi:hypothetical protein